MKVIELKYSNTNTYLIEGSKGKILFDTGWAGTFAAFCKCMGDAHVSAQNVTYVLISHFHPDHVGIAQEIANLGATIVVMDVQKDFIHAADSVFAKEKNSSFLPIREDAVKLVSLADSRAFLRGIGLDGEIVSTPGHSDDSISLCLDDGSFFVGDLNPLYELELHQGTQIEASWKKLLERKPRVIYYGHAKTATLEQPPDSDPADKNLHALTLRIMKYIDKGVTLEKIRKKTGADPVFIEDVARMYLTHPGVGVQGILDRIEIKGR